MTELTRLLLHFRPQEIDLGRETSPGRNRHGGDRHLRNRRRHRPVHRARPGRRRRRGDHVSRREHRAQRRRDGEAPEFRRTAAAGPPIRIAEGVAVAEDLRGGLARAHGGLDLHENNTPVITS